MEKKFQKLKTDISKKLASWNERSNFKLKGISNLSKSDLDTIILYADTINSYGTYEGLMKPVGNVKEVLVAYGILEKEV